MRPADTRTNNTRAYARLSPAVQLALAWLAEADEHARAARRDPWEFAVEIRRLTEAGLTVNDLRWLIVHDCVRHGWEVTQPTDRVRQFQGGQNLALTPQTCFVLTDRGRTAVQSLRQSGLLPALVGHGPLPGLCLVGAESCDVVKAPRPSWDAQRRVLMLGGQTVKQFRVPASNQERVLAAFEKEGWPLGISDPLHPTTEIAAKIRLHDTIKALNRNQIHPLVYFSGDGTGEGVLWRLANCRASDAPSRSHHAA